MSDHPLVLVTGGGGILGRAMTATLTSRGYRVAVVDRDLDAAVEAAEDLGNALAHPYRCDITSREDLLELRATLTETTGPVDALVNNAASKSENFFAPFEDFPVDDWNEVMATNLTGPMLCSQVFGAPMAARESGSIVNTLSVYGITAPDQRIYEGSSYEGRAINTPAIYSASKAGLWGLTQYLASYWGASNVRVNAIVPGGVFSGQNDTFVEAYSKRTMLGRMAESHEIADATRFLVSDESSYITGQQIVVDGGLTAW